MIRADSTDMFSNYRVPKGSRLYVDPVLMETAWRCLPLLAPKSQFTHTKCWLVLQKKQNHTPSATKSIISMKIWTVRRQVIPMAISFLQPKPQSHLDGWATYNLLITVVYNPKYKSASPLKYEYTCIATTALSGLEVPK